MNRTKNIIFALLVLLGLSSCNNQFDRVPGVVYEEVPGGLRGNYVAYSGKGKTDTLRFEVKKHFIVNKGDDDKVDSLAIHKDFEVSSFDKYLFFSVKDHDKIYQIAKVELKDDYIEMNSIFAENAKDNKKLGKYFNHTEEPKRGDTVTVYKMDEKALLKYFKKHVKKKNAQRIYKVK